MSYKDPAMKPILEGFFGSSIEQVNGKFQLVSLVPGDGLPIAVLEELKSFFLDVETGCDALELTVLPSGEKALIAKFDDFDQAFNAKTELLNRTLSQEHAVTGPASAPKATGVETEEWMDHFRHQINELIRQWKTASPVVSDDNTITLNATLTDDIVDNEHAFLLIQFLQAAHENHELPFLFGINALQQADNSWMLQFEAMLDPTQDNDAYIEALKDQIDQTWSLLLPLLNTKASFEKLQNFGVTEAEERKAAKMEDVLNLLFIASEGEINTITTPSNVKKAAVCMDMGGQYFNKDDIDAVLENLNNLLSDVMDSPPEIEAIFNVEDTIFGITFANVQDAQSVENAQATLKNYTHRLRHHIREMYTGHDKSPSQYVH